MLRYLAPLARRDSSNPEHKSLVGATTYCYHKESCPPNNMSTLGCTLSTSGSIESSSLETVYQDYGWHEDVVKQQVPIDVCDPCIRFFKEASFSTDIEFKEPTASSIAKRCGLCLRIDSSARPGINWIYSGLKSDQNRYCALKAFRAPFEAEAPWFAVWADEG